MSAARARTGSLQNMLLMNGRVDLKRCISPDSGQRKIYSWRMDFPHDWQKIDV